METTPFERRRNHALRLKVAVRKAHDPMFDWQAFSQEGPSRVRALSRSTGTAVAAKGDSIKPQQKTPGTPQKQGR
jgi:hypothetical protein